jgi:hypothetical protein
MPKVLFLFLDGVGLGANDPHTNPFALASMPHLEQLLNGRRLLADAAPLHGERATLLALDACLGVPGLPQSATGQAVLLTGENVPAAIGGHYGPKPTPEITRFLQNGSLFSRFQKAGFKVGFLNAYPPRYFAAIQSGYRKYSAIPLAVTSAGIPLRTLEDLLAGQAISADFTAQGWKDHLGIPEAPQLDPFTAGKKLAQLASEYDFAFFEYWLSDYAGHHQDMAAACSLLETLDQVIAGLAAAWDASSGLAFITSDHGNLEDLSTRRHTPNKVPGLLLGDLHLRQKFALGLEDLSGVAPAVIKLVTS